MQRDTILRNASFAFIVKISGAVFTAALTLFLVRYLGPEGYGTFALAMSIGALVLLPSDVGIAQATARFLAESWDDKPYLTAVLSDSLRLKAVASGVISIALIALAGTIAEAYNAPEMAWPLRILSLSLFFESFFLLFGSVFQALGRVSVFLRVVLVKSSSESVLSVGMVLLGAGVSGAMAGRTAGYAFAVGYALILVLRFLAPARVRIGKGAGGNLRRIIGYGSALLIVDSAFTLFGEIDSLLIGAILSVEDVGLFSAPSQILVMVGYVGLSVSSGVAPRLIRTGTREPDKASLERGLRFMVAFQGIFLAPLIVWAEPITTLLLGPGYEDSASVLRGLTPFAFMVGISPMLAMSVNYLGEARKRIPIAISALLINAAFDFVFLPHIGIIAGAIGTDIAYGLYLGAHLVLLRSLISIELAPVILGAARSLLAAALMAAVLMLFGTQSLSPITLVLGGAIGSFVYVTGLILTGAMTVNETRRALGIVRRSL